MNEDEGVSKECKLPYRLNLQLLHILASLVLAQIFNIRLNVKYSFSDATTKLHLTKRIITDDRLLKMKIDELEAEVEEKDEEMKRLREALKHKEDKQ